jgi:hypothetical protein
VEQISGINLSNEGKELTQELSPSYFLYSSYYLLKPLPMREGKRKRVDKRGTN